MKKNNIILIGMMGAGKSSVANALCEKLPNYKLVDTDNEIEKQNKMNVAEIFDKYSESHFRKLETELISEICKNNNLIISTGGGIFENKKNRQILLNNGIVFFLNATTKELFNRIKNDTTRPLLKPGFSEDDLNSILQKRLINYQKAHYTIDTTNKTFYNIIKAIMERIL